MSTQNKIKNSAAKAAPKNEGPVKPERAELDRILALLDNLALDPDCPYRDDDILSIRQIMDRLGIEIAEKNRIAFNHAFDRRELPRVDRPGNAHYARWGDTIEYMRKGTHHQRRRKTGVPATSEDESTDLVSPTEGGESVGSSGQNDESKILPSEGDAWANIPSATNSSLLPPSVDAAIEPAILVNVEVVEDQGNTAQGFTPGNTASTETLSDDDLRVIAEQEAIVASFVEADGLAKEAKAAAPTSKRNAEKAGIQAARALERIHSYLGKGNLPGHSSFHGYCKDKWNLSKSHTYRLLAVGDFIARFESQSPNMPIGDWVPLSESHVRPLLTTVPESQQVVCWSKIVAKSPPDQLTGSMVKGASMEFIRLQSGEPAVPQVTQHDVKKRIEKPVGKIRAAFDGVVEPDRYEPLLAQLLELAERIDCSVGTDTACESGRNASVLHI